MKLSTGALSRTVVAPLSSAIIALMLAGIVVVGVDQVGETIEPGTARLRSEGKVEVALNGDIAFSPVEQVDVDVLDQDDRVRVIEGKAVLEMSDGVRAELREGSTVSVAPGEMHLQLETGDLLVESRGRDLNVDGGIAQMTVTGVAKLRRTVSLVAGVYEGQVMMTKDERDLVVRRYRQAAAAGTGILPTVPEPLRLDPSDAWDQRILPKVLDLDADLDRLGRGFEAELPATLVAGPELFRQVVPKLADAPITPQDLFGRSPGENLIGFVLVAEDKGDFVDRVRNVFGFRAQGASWGLVAAERELNTNPVLGGMESALGALNAAKAPTASETPRGELTRPDGTGRGSEPGGTPRGGVSTPAKPNTTGTTPTGPGTTPGGSSPGTTTPPPSGGTPPPSGGTPPTPPPSTPPPEEPKLIDVPQTGVSILDGVLDPVVEPLEDLLSGVLDGLLGLAPAQSPTSQTSSGLLGGLLGG